MLNFLILEYYIGQLALQIIITRSKMITLINNNSCMYYKSGLCANIQIKTHAKETYM